MAVGWFSKLADLAKRAWGATKTIVQKAVEKAPAVLKVGQGLMEGLNVNPDSKLYKNTTKLRRGLETVQPIITRLIG